MSNGLSPDMTIAAIRHLPHHARMPAVERIRIGYPRMTQILADIQRCHVQQPVAAEPPCLLILGQTGAGKSTLVRWYAQDHPRRMSPAGVTIPVLQATIIPPATVKGMAMTLLRALGDPASGYGTTTGMTHRLIGLIAACSVELLILDELQHFVDRDSEKVLRTVSNWLKTVIKETHVACVLVGLEGEAEQVVASNPQLGRLFGDPVILQPFAWDPGQPATITAFRALLATIENQLPLNAPSQLAHPDMAQRIFVASQGIMGYVMALIRHATYLALAGGHEQLDTNLLATAFTTRLGSQRRAIANPFVGPVPPIGTTAGVRTPSSDQLPQRRRTAHHSLVPKDQ